MRRQLKFEDYDGFVEKFKPKKTTDDCYTPEAVYQAVLDWCVEEYGIDRGKIIRPFYPGGDYEACDYPDGYTVVDNPPFSILSKIISFYLDSGVKFFLFAPALTVFSSQHKQVCSICAFCRIIYENGANVKTSFITNMETAGVRSAPELNRRINESCKKGNAKQLPKYQYPDEVLTATRLNSLSEKGVNLKIESRDIAFIRGLDYQKPYDKSIYGAGFLMSESATEALKAKELVAEELAVKKLIARELSAKELKTKKGAIVWNLSEREREIVKQLGVGKQ